MTIAELKKYNSFNDFEGNGIPENIKTSNGDEIKTMDTSYLDKVTGWDNKFPFKMKSDKQMEQFIATPKFVGDGRLGYTRYVKPIIDDAQEQYSRGYN